ncbi:MAG: hypothetical protein M1819_000294 [Sarea resinae]|nr:MAG: hypothetical protein M1819_000294 [Sarea resinae]
MSVGKAQIFAPLANAIRRAFMSSPSHLVHALPFEDFVVAFASDPPGMKYEVLLVESLALKFEGVRHRILPNGLNYQQSQGFGRACVFDMLNRIKGPSILTGRAIFDKLLTPWYTQKQPAPIVCKWKKTTQLQMMVILARQGVIDDVGEARREVFHRLLTVLSLESLPKYRSLLQWTILALIPEDATYDAQSLLSILESLDQSKPKYLASTIKIAVLIAKDAASDESYCSKLIKLVVFWTASSKVVVRYEAQRALLSIFAHAKERGWKSIIEDPILIAIDASYQMTKKETEHAHNIKFESFDSIRNPTLTDIFEGDYLLVEPAELPCVTRTDFVTVSQTDTTMERGLLDSHPSVLLGEERRRVIGDILEQTNAQKTSQLVHNMPLQIKSGSSRSPALSVRASNTFGADSHLRPHDFILIASLIENPYNIGGLSRVAEIFGAKSLCVRDLGVRKHVQFTSVAVSSHLWLPMEELPVGGVAEFLRQKRLDGYSIAGIEQTDVSKVLGKGDWKFPKKTVLLLGSERGGIPAPLLAEMDVCVEVKQAGVTRSMNVQTAAAIVLYEYARQHR